MSAEGTESAKPEFGVEKLMDRVKKWKQTLEEHVLTLPVSVSLAETSQALSMFANGDTPDLWSGSCDPNYSALRKEMEKYPEPEAAAALSSTSSSAVAARRAASLAAITEARAASRDGMGGGYGVVRCTLKSRQYAPNSSTMGRHAAFSGAPCSFLEQNTSKVILQYSPSFSSKLDDRRDLYQPVSTCVSD